MRKPVQIAAICLEGEESCGVLYALCDDGSIWSMWFHNEFPLEVAAPHEWKQVPGIPDDED